MDHDHWHISYMTAAGYRVLDNVPFTSEIACKSAIASMPWSPGEKPKPHQVTAPHCIGGCF
jgi:hypothetical protein